MPWFAAGHHEREADGVTPVVEQLVEDGQTVKGAIVALEDDQRLRHALAAPNIEFYRYEVGFKFLKA